MNCCEVGTFKCSVKINNFFVDRCIQEEIRELLKHGIKTMASCCGHQETECIVGVSDDSVKKMHDLGYKKCNKYENTFYLKLNQ